MGTPNPAEVVGLGLPWPTPMARESATLLATDAVAGGVITRKSGHRRGLSLTDKVNARRRYPTPSTADSWAGALEPGYGSPTMLAQAVNWPTPRAMDGAMPTGQWSSRERTEASSYGPMLSSAVRLGRRAGGTSIRPTLGLAAASPAPVLIGTPTASFGLRGGSGSAHDAGKWLRKGDEGYGELNPDWVEWLMGWPIGWTGLRRLGTGRCPSWRRQHLRILRRALGLT